ncbi:MAG: hypothetical protein Q9161_007298 [Pseudevernia consocians]
MHPHERSAQPGSSSQAPIIIIDDQTSRGTTHPRRSPSSATLPEPASNHHQLGLSHDPGTVDTVYQIVCSTPPGYSLNGNVYFRYNIPPQLHSTGWYCIVAFHWHDVQAEFECIYHPSVQLFDDFKAVPGSLRGGGRGAQSVQISMWQFADRGPDFSAKHTVRDDGGNRIMLAVVVLRGGELVRLFGKLVRDGEDGKGVWLSVEERGRLGLRP